MPEEENKMTEEENKMTEEENKMTEARKAKRAAKRESKKLAAKQTCDCPQCTALPTVEYPTDCDCPDCNFDHIRSLDLVGGRGDWYVYSKTDKAHPKPYLVAFCGWDKKALPQLSPIFECVEHENVFTPHIHELVHMKKFDYALGIGTQEEFNAATALLIEKIKESKAHSTIKEDKSTMWEIFEKMAKEQGCKPEDLVRDLVFQRTINADFVANGVEPYSQDDWDDRGTEKDSPQFPLTYRPKAVAA